jgi:hypothetical protein
VPSWFYTAGKADPVQVLAGDGGFVPIGGFLVFGGSGLEPTEANTQVQAEAAYIWSHIACRVTTNTLVNANSIFARLNGVDVAALEALIPATSTGWFEDTTGSQAVAIGDLINYSLPSLAGMHATALFLANVSSRLDQSSSAQRRPIVVATAPESAWITNQGEVEFGPIVGWLTVGTATESAVQYILRQFVTFSNMRIFVSANNTDGSSTFDLREDGVSSTNLTISIGSGATGSFEDNDSEEVSPGTAVNYRKQAAVGAGGDTLEVAIAHMLMGGSVQGRNLGATDLAGQNVGAGGGRFYALEDDLEGTGTESDAQQEVPVAVDVANLFVRIFTNTLATAATAVNVRVNGSNALSLSIAAGATGAFENAVDVVSLAVDDNVNYELRVAAGGGGAITPSMICVEQRPPDEMPWDRNLQGIHRVSAARAY